ncbi:MAG: sigma-54-dependent Fis family transcriptional regulator [Chitinophagaceae bacterium]|nr:sigma-54-dependent Fis family transcriptional regulator [Chitinophagaceae bacterium]MBL0334850.1 sigma-54-dependent Fis family transcriptional regulator [Chitinophagaceae bacterium]
METFRIFIVEDDPWYGEILEYHLSLNPEYQVTRFSNGRDCLSSLHKKPALITIDFSLPDMNGQELYKQIRRIESDVPVIVISGQEDISTAVELLKLGVSDYLVKDDNTKELLWNAVIRIRENQKLKKEVEQLREELGQKYEFEKIIRGNSAAIRKIFSLMEKATRTQINVSVTGETGTGKELVAKAIHYNSDRKKKPFVAVNMAAIPSELVESELFGYEKGAFTGAVTRKIGKFEEAQKGTIFLDEIAELDMNVQSKLLRVLQERELVRLGGNEKITLDVRLIVATHQNLAETVSKGLFREDLFYRIMGLPIELPPLRERDNDVLLLAHFFVEEFCRENRMPQKQITAEAKEKLMKYNFPGNVRELKAMMDLASVMSEGNEISEEDISYTHTGSNEYFLTEEKTMKDYTIQIIRHFLKKYDNNVLRVAEKLDIGKSTIYKMIQQKDIVV